MMISNFFKKNDEVEVEWWSDVDALNDPSLDYLRPQKASKFFPEWFKRVQSSKEVRGSGNIKNCPVFPEYLTQGWIIPMWCDSELYFGDDGWKWNTPTDAFRWDMHSHDQFLDWLPKEQQEQYGWVWKPHCPWKVKTPKGYSMYQVTPFYHFQKWTILPGSIRTDFHYELNQQVLFPKEFYNKEILIERGTPFGWYIPYKRTKYKETFVPYDEERKRMQSASWLNIFTSYRDGYKKRVKMEDKNDKEK